MSDDLQLSELLHRSGDAWIPAAEPEALAADLLARLEGGRARQSAGSRARWRPGLTVGQALRVALTVCFVVAAIAVPLALRGGGSKPATPAAGALSLTPLPMPAGFVSPQAQPAMSCTGPDFCMVVGAFRDVTAGSTGRAVPASYVLSGGHGLAPQLIPQDVTFGAPLDAVSCTSPVDCVAASLPVRHAGAEHVYLASFDGTAWQPLAPPPGWDGLVRSGGQATRVSLSCAAGSCTIVGTTDRFVGPVFSAQLDGGTWRVLPPFPKGSHPDGYFLHSLSCGAPDDCYAAGSKGLGAAPDACPKKPPVTQGTGPTGAASSAAAAARASLGCGGVAVSPIVVHWDGTAWRDLPAPPRAGPGGSSLDFLPSVSCPTQAECFVVNAAIGASSTQAIEEITAGGWAVADTPSWPPQAEQVTCPTASYCMVSGDPGYPQLHDQVWWYLSGDRWFRGSAALPASEYLAMLGTLSCTGAGQCYQLYSTDTYHPYAAGTSYLLELTTLAAG